MKLLKRLTVNGVEYPVVAEEVRLDLDRPGVAQFGLVAALRSRRILTVSPALLDGWFGLR